MTTEVMGGASVVRTDIGPRGPRPHKLSASRVGIYAFLIVMALFFLLPLWVMLVSSRQTMPEIRRGQIF